ncbi:MAG TPA: hypothetical protein VIX14_16580 [Terriglobales bacterium]
MSIENNEQQNDKMQKDEQQILELHEAGEAFTKRDGLNNFRTEKIRCPSIVLTGRRIRVSDDTAVVHGSESDEIEINGKRSAVR